MLPPEEPLKINTDVRQQWNNFIKFLEGKGMRGNPEFDHNPDLINGLMAEYAKANPGTVVGPQLIKPIQRAMNEYRQQALDMVHSGKASLPDGVTEDQFMNGLSIEDGIPGQKTTNWMFPEKSFIIPGQGKPIIKSFGLDYEAYDDYANGEGRVPQVSASAR